MKEAVNLSTALRKCTPEYICGGTCNVANHFMLPLSPKIGIRRTGDCHESSCIPALHSAPHHAESSLLLQASTWSRLKALRPSESAEICARQRWLHLLALMDAPDCSCQCDTFCKLCSLASLLKAAHGGSVCITGAAWADSTGGPLKEYFYESPLGPASVDEDGSLLISRGRAMAAAFRNRTGRASELLVAPCGCTRWCLWEPSRACLRG